MKTIFFKKNEPKEGYTSLVSKENTYLNDLEIGRLRLGKKGDKFSGQNIIVDGGWLSSAWFGKYNSKK